MKKRLFLFSVFCLLFSLSACAQTPSTDSGSATIIPQLPQQVDFAGEQVPLENFDTRESLERELIITTYMHSRTLYALQNTTRYFPVIEPILEKNGIPADFKYLCMAESGLNPNIVSPAGAAGLWQIMPAVGREYGMVVSAGVDERFHVEKATQAACDYLNAAYKQFGSWAMAAAAYNLGPSGVTRRAGIQGVSNYFDLFLPEETMRYVSRIVALKLVTESPEDYGLIVEKKQFHAPLDSFREVEVNDAQIEWSDFARRQGTSYKMLRELNPWIRDYDYTNAARRMFVVRIPLNNFRER